MVPAGDRPVALGRCRCDELLSSGITGRGTRVRASVLGWAGILTVGMGMAAVEIVPASQVLPWVQIGPQGDGASATSRNYQLHLANALQLLSPRALGGPDDYFGHDNYWESVLSFGLVTLVLIGAGIPLSRSRTKVRGWLALVLLAIWYRGGTPARLSRRFSPRLVPGMSWFRVPARSLFLASVGVAVLAGFGVQALQERLDASGPVATVRQPARQDRSTADRRLVPAQQACCAGRRGPATEHDALCPNFEATSSAAAVRLVDPAPPVRVSTVWRATGRILHDPACLVTVAMLGLAVGLGLPERPPKIRGRAVHLLGSAGTGRACLARLRAAPGDCRGDRGSARPDQREPDPARSRLTERTLSGPGAMTLLPGSRGRAVRDREDEHQRPLPARPRRGALRDAL